MYFLMRDLFLYSVAMVAGETLPHTGTHSSSSCSEVTSAEPEPETSQSTNSSLPLPIAQPTSCMFLIIIVT